jgi:hypothetical protein
MATNKQVPEEDETPRFKDQRTDDRIHQLLSNENDEVTEDDIRNVRTDIGTDSATPPAPPAPLQEDTGKAAEEIDPKDPNDPGIETPWNMIEE